MTEVVDIMVEGGAAKAGASMGQALGPLGLDMQKIISDINEKTSAFKGLQVPVKIKADPKTKTYELEIGAPPISQLIKGKAGITKGGRQAANEEAGKTGVEWVGNISLSDLKEIALSKKDSNLSHDDNKLLTQAIGTCQSMGVKIDNEFPKKIKI